jgi:hypothetical protein
MEFDIRYFRVSHLLSQNLAYFFFYVLLLHEKGIDACDNPEGRVLVIGKDQAKAHAAKLAAELSTAGITRRAPDGTGSEHSAEQHHVGRSGAGSRASDSGRRRSSSGASNHNGPKSATSNSSQPPSTCRIHVRIPLSLAYLDV